jgi:hypothetical protein
MREANFTYQGTVYTVHYETLNGQPEIVKVTLEDSEEREELDYYGYNEAYDAIERNIVERSKRGYNE